MIALDKYTILQKLQPKFFTLPGKINLEEFNNWWWANREVLARSMPEEMYSHLRSEQSIWSMWAVSCPTFLPEKNLPL